MRNTSLDGVMRRSILLLLGIALLGQLALADDWPAAQVTTAWSDDGRRFVRVEPGESVGDTVGFAGAKRGAWARGSFYVRQPDRAYALAAEVSLRNPVAPVDLLLADSGYLIAFDNWHNVGYGKVVAIYDPAGQLVAAWELEQLYTPAQLAAIQTSESSRWWRCAPWHFVDPEEQSQVYVREALGGSFVFVLRTGEVTYFPGSADCARPTVAVRVAGQPPP